MNSIAFYKKFLDEEVLSKEQEYELITRAQNGDKSAYEKVVNANIRYAIYASKRYLNCGLSQDDVISAANIGLVKAVERFDTSRNLRFVTFAAQWIKHEILNEIENTARFIRLPQSRENQLLSINKILESLPEDLTAGEKKSVCLELLGIREEVYNCIMETIQGPASLDFYNEEDEKSGLYEYIKCDEDYNPENELITREMKKSITKALSTLTPKEAFVVRCRTGIGYENPMSLSVIGKMLGVSKEGVRHIESKAYDKLREREASRYLEGFIAA